MTTPLRYRLLQGTALILFLAGVAYSCKDFLSTPSQGTLDATALQNKSGVEATLIAAYRALDCTTTTNANWGCAASNWVWSSVTSDDAYKGSNATDQPPINDIEEYVWSTGDAESYLNVKWRQVYEGVVRANATLNLLKQVQAAKPLEIPAADASSIKGEALFLRAHYHFEAWRMWGNSHLAGSRFRHRVPARDAPERTEGPRDGVDGQGVQGPAAGLHRQLCRRVGHVEGRPGERGLFAATRLSSGLDGREVVLRWPGNHLGVSGLRE